MSDDDRFERGVEMLQEVYAGAVPALPKGMMPAYDLMIETLFADVWSRDVLSIRDRRLLLMGVIAAQGQSDVWKIQARAALDRGELTPDELRETVVILAPYAGYPNAAALIGEAEGVIGEHQAAAADDG